MPFDWVLDLFFKRNCPICNRSTDGYLCVYCTRPILACRSPQFCETQSPFTLFCWGIYDDALKRAIATCKYQNQPTIAFYLGQQMGEAWKNDRVAQALKKLIVVPIPLHPEKQKKRGFNQAELLARGFCDKTNMQCRTDLLQRIKNTKPQMQTSSKEERIENLAKAFVCPSVKINRPILLVDDIYTTGTTVNEAINTLSQANLPVVAVLVLARTALHDR